MIYKKMLIELIKTIDNEKLLSYLYCFAKCCKEHDFVPGESKRNK